jgi:hypothetical protein
MWLFRISLVLGLSGVMLFVIGIRGYGSDTVRGEKDFRQGGPWPVRLGGFLLLASLGFLLVGIILPW